MATFYTNPAISFQGLRQPENPSELLTRFAQLKQMSQERQMNDLRMKEGNLRLAELQRMTNEGAATRNAYGAAVTPGTGGAPPTFDRSKMLQSLAGNPQTTYLVPQAQAGFAAQDAAQKEQLLKLAKEAEDFTEEQLKNAKTRVDMMGSLAQSVIVNPGSYPSAKATAEKLGLVQPGKLPEQFTPDLLPQLHGLATQAVAVKDTLTAEETRRHNLEMEKRKPVPGVDVPLSPDVEAQRKRISAAGRAGEKPISQSQRNAAERWKQSQLHTLRAEATRRQQAVDRGEPNAEAMSEEDFRNRWQEIQDSYEGQLASGQHLDIPVGMARENLPGGGALNPPSAARPTSKGKLSLQQASEYLQRAGGDKAKARAMAKADGWEF